MSNEQHAERDHAPCSPSILKNRKVCPSYESDNEGPPHSLTVSGERIHEALDRDDDFSALDAGEVHLAQYCADYRDTHLGPHDMWDIHKEILLQTGDPDCWGYVDFLAVGKDDPAFAHLMDWKTGYGYQGDAGDNPQIKAYVLGAWRQFPDLERVHAHMPYPRLDHTTSFIFNRSEDFTRLEDDTFAIVEGWRKGGFTPDLDNCTYCAKKLSCPHAMSTSLQILEDNHDGYGIDFSTDLQDINDPGQMAKLLAFAPLMEDMADKIKKFALNMRLEDGVDIPGFELTERRGKLIAKDVLPLVNKAREMGLDDDDISSCLSLKLPALAKAVGQAQPRGQKKKVEDKFRQDALDADLAIESEPSVYLRKSRKALPDPDRGL